MDGLASRSSGVHNLSEAIKLQSSMRATNKELQIIFTSIKTQANEVEKLDITDKFAIDFKTAVALVRNRVVSLESFGPKLARKGEELNNKTRKYIKAEKVTAAELSDIVSTLQDALDMENSFAVEYEEFKKELAAAHKAAGDMEQSLKKQQEEKEKEESSKRKWGYAKAAGAGALIVGGFFTGGVMWGAAGAAAGVSAYNSVQDSKELNRLASKLRDQADQLRNLVNGLASISHRAEGLSLSPSLKNALQQALAMCQRDHQRQQELEEAQRQSAEKDRQLEEQQRELEELRQQNAAMKKGQSK